MRYPVIIGVVLALIVGTATLLVLLGTVLAEPPQVPTPAVPTVPPIAQPSPSPTAAPSPTAPVESPSPGETPDPGSPEPPEIGVDLGDEAPRIRLPALEGATLDTAEYAGRPLWINFMATWCPQCVDELPMMEVMQEQLGDSMAIVLVDIGEDEATVARFVEDLGVTLPVGIDAQAETQREWGAWVLPVHYWIDGDGVVRSVVFGGAPRSVFEESVLNLVPDAEFD